MPEHSIRRARRGCARGSKTINFALERLKSVHSGFHWHNHIDALNFFSAGHSPCRHAYFPRCSASPALLHELVQSGREVRHGLLIVHVPVMHKELTRKVRDLRGQAEAGRVHFVLPHFSHG